MKNILYLALAGTLVFGSCQKDFLERPPLNDVSETEFWKNEQHVYLAVNAIYADMPEATMHEDASTDIAYAQYPWETTSVAIATGNFPTTLDAGWNYIAIRKANYFLDNVDKAVMDETLKARYKAEVRFMRAFYYANLVNKFGDVPLITKELTLEESNVPRTPKAEVIQFVLDELSAVSGILPINYSGGKPNELGRVTKGAALALKARFELYQSDWNEAAQTAREVMDLGYQLFQVSDELEIDQKDDYSKLIDFKDAADQKKFRLGLRSYEGLFHQINEGNKEVILDRQYMEQSQAQLMNTFLLDGSVGGWSSVTPTQNLVNAYQSYHTGEAVVAPTNAQRAENYAKADQVEYLKEFKNRDPRFYATVLFDTAPWNALIASGNYSYKWVTGNNMSKVGYNFRKLVDPKSSRENIDNHANVIVIRYAEVLLTFAEAQNEVSGPSNEVYDALDKIRTRAGMPKVDRSKYSSQPALRDLIRQERLIEMAGEGLRYMDIRRWNTAANVMKDIYSVKNFVVQEREWTEKLMLMPVPQKEIDNAHGVLKQNPGY